MIFLSTGGFRKNSAFKTSRYYLKNNIKNIELSSGLHSKNILTELNKLKRKANIRIHNYFPPPKIPFVLNLCSRNSSNLKKTINHIKQGIVLAKKTNSKYYSFHAGFRFDPEIKELGKKISKKKLMNKSMAYKIFYQRLIKINEFAKKNKIKLLVENNVISEKNLKEFRVNPFLLTNPKEIEKFFSNLDNNIGLLFDVAHFKVSSNSEKFDLKRGYKKIYKYIKAIHLSDNDGKADTNSIIKKNSWFLKILKKNLDYYSIEVYSKNIKLLKSQINLIKNHI